MHHNPFVKYRPDIDGLRAVAVLSVVLFHAFPQALPGGFIGVDIFFVISGYLISSIVMEGLEKGRFTFLDFYSRRIKRIFPALLIVLFSCYIFGWFSLFRSEFEQLGKHIAAGAAFVSNIALMRETGYFDTEAELKPLLHLWSLGIEEQFYFVWPALIWLAARWRLNLKIWISLGITLSFLASVVGGILRPELTFFLPFTRFWELMCGGLLAHWHQQHHASKREPETVVTTTEHLSIFGNQSPWLPATIGIILIVGALVFLDGDRAQKMAGWWAIFPTMGAVLVIAAGPRTWVNHYLLSNRVMVFVGLISYPLYLWHWPLLSFARITLPGTISDLTKLGLVILAIALAYLTYRLVEIPVRRNFTAKVPLSLAAGVTFMAIVGLLSPILASYRSAGLQERDNYVEHFDNRDFRYIRNNHLAKTYWFQCDFYDFLANTRKSAIDPSCIASGKGQKVLLWGDSHAQALSLGIRHALPESVHFLQVTTSGCTPSLTDSPTDRYGSCNRSNRLALDVVAKQKPDVVIIAQRFHHDKVDWFQIARHLKSLGADTVILIGPIPQWKPSLPLLFARSYWPNLPSRLTDGLMEDIVMTERYLKAHYSGSAEIKYVSLFTTLCNDQGCLTKVGNRIVEDLVSWDYGHLTSNGSEYVALHAIAPAIKQSLSVQSLRATNSSR
jgi:hypothetical protein